MNRWRQDNALEVLVDNRLVGWLTDTCNVPADQKTLTVIKCETTEGGFFDEERCFHLTDFSRRIDARRLQQRRDAGQDVLLDVAGYALRHNDRSRDESIFTWRILRVTDEQYEWLFDLESFEPYDDGVPDMETRRQERFDAEIGEVIDAQITILTNQAFTGSMTNATQAMSTLSSTANESALSVEKFQDAMKLMQATMKGRWR